MNIYETFTRGERESRCARWSRVGWCWVLSIPDFFSDRVSVWFRYPVPPGRYHRIATIDIGEISHPPPFRTTFFHLSATPVFTIARHTLRTEALFFRYFSFDRRWGAYKTDFPLPLPPRREFAPLLFFIPLFFSFPHLFVSSASVALSSLRFHLPSLLCLSILFHVGEWDVFFSTELKYNWFFFTFVRIVEACNPVIFRTQSCV